MRRDSKNNMCGSEETAGKLELKTLYDYEMLLRDIRLAHVEKDKEKLDALFTELYASAMVSCGGDGDGYKIQKTPFRSLVLKQYNKIARRVELSCDSFEDVMQSVMTGIYDGSVFFRGLQKCDPEKRAERLGKILNSTSCWWQINDYICDRTGGGMPEAIRYDLGIFNDRSVVVKDGKKHFDYIGTVSMQRELDMQTGAGHDRLGDDGKTALQKLVDRELACDPISDLIDGKEQSPMEEVAVKLAEAFYKTIIKYQYDEQDRADLLLYAQQLQNPVAPEMRTEKILTFASLPVAESFFHFTLRRCQFLGKALSMLSDDDLKKFSTELDIILAGTDDFQKKKNLVTACLSYIKDKQEEVA